MLADIFAFFRIGSIASVAVSMTSGAMGAEIEWGGRKRPRACRVRPVPAGPPDPLHGRAGRRRSKRLRAVRPGGGAWASWSSSPGRAGDGMLQQPRRARPDPGDGGGAAGAHLRASCHHHRLPRRRGALSVQARSMRRRLGKACGEAIAQAERAVSLSPNATAALGPSCGWVRMVGRATRGRPARPPPGHSAQSARSARRRCLGRQGIRPLATRARRRGGDSGSHGSVRNRRDHAAAWRAPRPLGSRSAAAPTRRTPRYDASWSWNPPAPGDRVGCAGSNGRSWVGLWAGTRRPSARPVSAATTAYRCHAGRRFTPLRGSAAAHADRLSGVPPRAADNIAPTAAARTP